MALLLIGTRVHDPERAPLEGSEPVEHDFRLLLFDDAEARGWEPFSATRPVGELLFGCMTLRTRSERAWGRSCTAYISSKELEDFDEPGAAPMDSGVGPPADPRTTDAKPTVLWSSRAAPDFSADELGFTTLDAAPVRLRMQGQTVGLVLPFGHPLCEDWILHPDGAIADRCVDREVPGDLLSGPWSLVAENPRRVTRDIDRALAYGVGRDAADSVRGIRRIGPHALVLGEGAEIEPGVTIDLRQGPVYLDAGARVEGPARLTGPLYLGPQTVVFGGHVGTSSIGSSCKLRGEIADSVLLDYVNKAHDGHLGHALLGRWVNLGAFTTNSDLKNNYGPVTVRTSKGPIDTGVLKVGCFLGDHVKTGIGTLFNTGTVVGAGSNLFGGAMPPSYVPPFSWGVGGELTTYRLDAFLETAGRAMDRRNQNLTPGVRRILTALWHATAQDRNGARPIAVAREDPVR